MPFPYRNLLRKKRHCRLLLRRDLLRKKRHCRLLAYPSGAAGIDIRCNLSTRKFN